MRTLWEYICEAAKKTQVVTLKAIKDAFASKYRSISPKSLELFRSDFDNLRDEQIPQEINLVLSSCLDTKKGYSFTLKENEKNMYPEVSNRWCSYPVVLNRGGDSGEETRYITIARYTGSLNGGDMLPSKILPHVTGVTTDKDNSLKDGGKTEKIKVYLITVKNLKDNLLSTIKEIYNNAKFSAIISFIEKLLNHLPSNVSIEDSNKSVTSTFTFNENIDTSDILVIQKNFGEILDALIIGTDADILEFPADTSNGLYDFKISNNMVSAKIGTGGHNPVITNLKKTLPLQSDNTVELNTNDTIAEIAKDESTISEEEAWLNHIIGLAVSPTLKERLVVINYYINKILKYKSDGSKKESILLNKFLNTENNFWSKLNGDNEVISADITSGKVSNTKALFRYIKEDSGLLKSVGTVSPADFMRYLYGEVFEKYEPSTSVCPCPWNENTPKSLPEIEKDKDFNNWFFNRNQKAQYGFLIYHAYHKSVKGLNYIKVNNKLGKDILTDFIIENFTITQSYLTIEYKDHNKQKENNVTVTYKHVNFTDMTFTFEPGGMTNNEPGRDKLSFKAHTPK